MIDGLPAEPYRKGRTVHGQFYTLPDGRRLYLARRKLAQVFKDREKSISDAIRAGTAAWGMEDDIALAIRARGIELAGVVVRETGDIYFTETMRFFDYDIAKVRWRRNMGRGAQRCLPFSCFERIAKANV